MYTRIEIDGFKTFEGFGLDLQPFSVIVGANATGKSNLFDALRFLSRLAEADIRTALRDSRGEPHELFRLGANGSSASAMKFAIEVLLDPNVKDPYGQEKALTNTRIRYEVHIEQRSIAKTGLEKLFVSYERASPILKKDDRLLQLSKKKDQDTLEKYAFVQRGKRNDFLAVETHGSAREIKIHQDGTAGRRRSLPLGEAEGTALSTIRTAEEFPHLFALREELASLQYLQLDPAAERLPSDLLAPDRLEPDGSNLAKVLARIKSETRTDQRPNGVLEDIRANLVQLVPGILDLEVERNEAAREYRLFLTMRDGTRFSSRVISDGTLRILALLTMLHDPSRRGVLCFEEPENGVHEGRVGGIISLLRDACVDLTAPPDPERRHLTQIIVNTHSPAVLRCLHPHEIILAETVAVSDPSSGKVARRTRMRTGVSDELALDRESRLTRYEIDQILRRELDVADQ
jgi:predicted ATPase